MLHKLSPAVWIGALLAYDLCCCWLHRLGHTVQMLWAAHVVHHSSEHDNLSTVLRQTGGGFLLGWVLYLPTAVAGVPPLVFAVVGLIDLLCQFWVHTRLVGRLGWFDWVFCSPSNHRLCTTARTTGASTAIRRHPDPVGPAVRQLCR